MSVKKTIMMSIVTIGFATAPVFAVAGNLHLINNTTKDTTTKTKGFCSTFFLGKDGITKAGQDRVVEHGKLVLACGGWGECSSLVFMNDNCQGEAVANVKFNTETGFGGVTMLSTKYKITGAGFDVRMDEVH